MRLLATFAIALALGLTATPANAAYQCAAASEEKCREDTEALGKALLGALGALFGERQLRADEALQQLDLARARHTAHRDDGGPAVPPMAEHLLQSAVKSGFGDGKRQLLPAHKDSDCCALKGTSYCAEGYEHNYGPPTTACALGSSTMTTCCTPSAGASGMPHSFCKKPSQFKMHAMAGDQAPGMTCGLVASYLEDKMREHGPDNGKQFVDPDGASGIPVWKMFTEDDCDVEIKWKCEGGDRKGDDCDMAGNVRHFAEECCGGAENGKCGVPWLAILIGVIIGLLVWSCIVWCLCRFCCPNWASQHCRCCGSGCAQCCSGVDEVKKREAEQQRLQQQNMGGMVGAPVMTPGGAQQVQPVYAQYGGQPQQPQQGGFVIPSAGPGAAVQMQPMAQPVAMGTMQPQPAGAVVVGQPGAVQPQVVTPGMYQTAGGSDYATNPNDYKPMDQSKGAMGM